MKRILEEQAGFTLVEVLVSVGILSVIMGTIGLGLFQSIGTQAIIIDDGHAIYELRKGLSWFGEDLMMAQSTDLVDAAPATSTVTFNWTNEYADASDSHSSIYSLVGGDLVRTYDGNSHAVARGVLSVSFTRSGDIIAAQLEVEAGSDTRTLTLQNALGAAP